MIFSYVKITCYFHVWRYHVFARKLNWYFIGVYIINCITLKQRILRLGWLGCIGQPCHIPWPEQMAIMWTPYLWFIQRNVVNQADEHLPSKWGQFLKMSGSFNMLDTREAAIVQENDFHKLLGGSRSLVNWETPLTITHSIFMSCAATKTPTTNSEQTVTLRRQHKINYFSLKLFLYRALFKIKLYMKSLQ